MYCAIVRARSGPLVSTSSAPCASELEVTKRLAQPTPIIAAATEISLRFFLPRVPMIGWVPFAFFCALMLAINFGGEVLPRAALYFSALSHFVLQARSAIPRSPAQPSGSPALDASAP